jgi:5-methylthioadenosine/S-adenosylhomocysteine deaminase
MLDRRPVTPMSIPRLRLVACLCLSAPLVHAGDAPAPALLIESGYVMTMDDAGDLAEADVLLCDGRIVAIGPGLEPAAHGIDAVERIDARGQIVMPGFIDTHSHLWTTTMRGRFGGTDTTEFFTVSTALGAVMTTGDIGTAMRLGALELLDGGITTTADFFDNVLTPAHAEAGLAALKASGIRARMYYGGPDRTTRHPIDIAHLERLAAARPDDARVGLGLAWRLPRDRDDAANWALRQREYDMARRAALPVQVHVSGEPGPMFEALIARGYLAPGVELVHATDATPAQLSALEAAGGSLSLTPISEHRVGYGLTRLAAFSRVDRQGLGIDGNALAGSGDMFATMRLAALTWTGDARDETAVQPRMLLELATLGGARALRMEQDVGSLAPGKRADLQLLRLDAPHLAGFAGGDPASLVVWSARPSDVATVIIDGVVRKRAGVLVDVDLPGLVRAANVSAAGMVERAQAAD